MVFFELGDEDFDEVFVGLHIDDFQLKNQGGKGWNIRARSGIAKAKFVRDDECAVLAFFHSGEAFGQSIDPQIFANGNNERVFVFAGIIDDRSIGQ